MNTLAVKIVGLGLAVAGSIASYAWAQTGERSVRDGVYSAAQAERGARVFESICMNCHDLGEFTGEDAYFAEVEGDPLWETFEYIWAEMPEDDPASLDPEEYAAVLAFLFARYGLPPGDVDLPVDPESLRAIVIAPPELPEG
jgi:mono/diheme cytochrome c family protein